MAHRQPIQRSKPDAAMPIAKNVAAAGRSGLPERIG
jgi:hypothetical protein